MTYKLTYIAYSDNQQLMNRSISILNDFFADEKYEIQEHFSGILFVASGGSEKNALELTKTKHNITLLCHRESNSYAATMEIASYLKTHGKKVSIIDVMAKDAYSEFMDVQKVNKAIESLSGQKAALIGDVSDWLINSDMEDALLKEKLGIDILRLPWSQLEDYHDKSPSKEFMTYFPEIDEAKLKDTSKVYHLLESIVKQNMLTAISVECFPMVRKDQVTACLPLAVLNNKHIVAACEGDICSMIGKMIVRALSELVPWQANVAEIKADSILFAHCTAPLNLLSSFKITTHYETNCGTAIEGSLKKGKVGAFRINSTLDRYMLLEGEIIDTPNHPFACRTQIEFKTSKEECALLKNNSLGNHHLIFPAEHISILKKMMQQLHINNVHQN